MIRVALTLTIAGLFTSSSVAIAGTEYEFRVAVPGLQSASAAAPPPAFATWDPNKNSNTTLSADLLSSSWALPSTPYLDYVLGTMAKSTGKWYWEVTLNASFGPLVGVASSSYAMNVNWTSNGSGVWGEWTSGYVCNAPFVVSGGIGRNASDVIGVALDMDAKTLSFYRNGTSLGVGCSNLTGTVVPLVGSSGGAGNPSYTANFGQTSFKYTPPAGFSRLQ